MQGLPRLVIYSYLEKRELMTNIRILSRKDRERVDTSYIIREGKGAFKAKLDLSWYLRGYREDNSSARFSVRAFDLVELSIDDAKLAENEYCYLLQKLASLLECAENRKTRLSVNLVIGANASTEV